VAGLSKAWGSVDVISGIDLSIAGGEFFTLLGPSGCGKTTTLMMLAGFVEPSAGEVWIDGRQVTHDPPQDRNIGVVFQSYALFPHMTVTENLAFPLEMRKVRRAEIDRRVAEVLDLIQLSAVGCYYPAQLSGGQQQRVAVARAVIFKPPVLLMDEPLGALDRKLRVDLQIELRRLQQRLGITVVYVTHDQDEAMSMSDRIALLNAGRLEQVGRPTEIYEEPASLFVARFLGNNNVMQGRISSENGRLRLDSGRLIPSRRCQIGVGEQVCAIIRSERVTLDNNGAQDAVEGRVQAVIFLGAQTEYRVDAAGLGEMRVTVQNTAEQRRWRLGDEVAICWKPDDLRLFRKESAGGEYQPAAPGDQHGVARSDQKGGFQ